MTQERNLYNISANAFLRRGSWFGIFMKPARFASPAKVGQWGTTDLFLGSRRTGAQHLADPMLMKLTPVHHGEKIAFRLHAEASELTVVTSYGRIRFTFADPSLILAKGENGLGLLLERDMEMHQMARRRGEKGWETAFGYVCSVVYDPLKGDIRMDAEWDYDRLSTPHVRGEVVPDENGEFLLAMEESEAFGRIRDAYPTYEEALADMTSEWEAFLEKQPLLAPEYAEDRAEAAYMTWSNLAGPAGLIRRDYLYMRSTDAASSWQMCQTAVALKNHLGTAVELLLNMLDRQGPNGQLPDFYSDARGAYLMVKPPLQGWALDILMREHDFSSEVPREKLERMYEGFSRYAVWFREYRGDGKNGLIRMEHGDETGSDDCPLFRNCLSVDAPSQNAHVALLYEKLGDLAGILGREEEKEAWHRDSRELIRLMTERFWNGERFTAFEHEHPEREIRVESINLYIPIVLGKRLPEEIVERMAEDLEEGRGYLSDAGFTTENLSSSPYTDVGAGRGKILPPDNILLATGLYAAGKRDLARRAAKLYCDGLKKRPGHFYAGGFVGSWAAAAFQILADLYSNG